MSEHADFLASAAVDDLQFDRWEAVIERELLWLVETGRMPAKETGLYALEAHRTGIYPTLLLADAASMLGLMVADLEAEVIAGRVEGVMVGGMVLVPISHLYAYAERLGISDRMPQGGGWDDVPDDERAQLRRQHELHVRDAAASSWLTPAIRESMLAGLAIDAARAEAYLRGLSEERSPSA